MSGRANEMTFGDAVKGLIAGDFSRLEPLFAGQTEADGQQCRIIEWYEANLFSGEPQALNEALTCACFNVARKSLTICWRGASRLRPVTTPVWMLFTGRRIGDSWKL